MKDKKYFGWKNFSIKVKLFISFSFCMLFFVGMTYIINNLVLEDYYQEVKESDLIEVYNDINTLFIDNDIVSSDDLDDIISRGNYSAVIINSSNRQEYIGGFFTGVKENLYSTIKSTNDLKDVPYVTGAWYDKWIRRDVIGLTGKLDNGYFLVVNLPIESVSESVGVLNDFLFLNSLICIIVSLVVMFFVARNLTKPIRELRNVTKEISELNFSKKCKVSSNDEIGELSVSVNTLSDKLYDTIYQLQQSNYQLILENEAKTIEVEARKEFIANASHELKTPIALISAYSEGLLQNIITDEESKKMYTEIIHDESEKMNMLIKKMTMLMQIQTGVGELAIERFNITELVADVVRSNEIILKEKNITVELDEQTNFYVWGDSYLIDNVITNYMTNAKNHTKQNGKITITLEEKEYSSDLKNLRVTINNSDSHINQDDIEKIWNSFYKVDKAHSRQYGGNGIGLSVVATIMNAHHKPYGVYNSENGVSFWFELEI